MKGRPIAPEWLISNFKRDEYVIQRLTEGLTHADSLLTPAAGGNCINWVLGHILVSRNALLATLGADRLWDEVTAARYRTGGEPITADSTDGVLPLERLLADVAASGEALAAALGSKTAEDLLIEGEDGPLGSVALGIGWHEAYHVGQIELLRRVAGKTEKVFG